MSSCRCSAVHENGYECLLCTHDADTPHYSLGVGYWGGRCKRCGRPAELAHEECSVPEKPTGSAGAARLGVLA